MRFHFFSYCAICLKKHCTTTTANILTGKRLQKQNGNGNGNCAKANLDDIVQINTSFSFSSAEISVVSCWHVITGDDMFNRDISAWCCCCTCAGAACVHFVPWRYVNIKVQIWTDTGLRNQTHSFQSADVIRTQIRSSLTSRRTLHIILDVQETPDMPYNGQQTEAANKTRLGYYLTPIHGMATPYIMIHIMLHLFQ